MGVLAREVGQQNLPAPVAAVGNIELCPQRLLPASPPLAWDQQERQLELEAVSMPGSGESLGLRDLKNSRHLPQPWLRFSSGASGHLPHRRMVMPTAWVVEK